MSDNKIYRLKSDLYLINGFSLLLTGIIALNQLHAVRVILGLPFILFFPGYTLIAVLFPGRTLDGLERTALSFGLSLAVVPLIGLGLNYTPWGIRLTPVLVSLVVFIFLLSVAAFFRRRKLEDAYYPEFRFNFPRWAELGRLDRILSVILVAAVLFAVGSIVYVVTTPKTGEKFTEFYILGPSGKADGYPRDLAPGQEGNVIVGVVNHEYAPVDYYVEITAGGYVKERTAVFRLTNGQKWEQAMSFAIRKPQADLEVRFLLFRQGETAPYRSLHLWVNVGTAKPAGPPVTTGGTSFGYKGPSTGKAVYR